MMGVTLVVDDISPLITSQQSKILAAACRRVAYIPQLGPSKVGTFTVAFLMLSMFVFLCKLFNLIRVLIDEGLKGLTLVDTRCPR